VAQSEIAELCQRIYHKHQRALDLIYEHRPDLQERIRALLVSLVEEAPGLHPDRSTKTYIRFVAREWDSPALRQGSGWTPSGRMLLFEFENAPRHLKLKLIIGPGPKEIRQKLHELAHRSAVLTAFRALAGKWNTIFLRDLLRAEDYDGASADDLEDLIREHWSHFLQSDLPRINETVAAERWIWEPPSNERSA